MHAGVSFSRPSLLPRPCWWREMRGRGGASGRVETMLVRTRIRPGLEGSTRGTFWDSREDGPREVKVLMGKRPKVKALSKRERRAVAWLRRVSV